MGQSMSTLDFFLIEGNDLLEQLDALTQHPAGTFLKGDDLLRLARAYRGSAVMGGQMGLAHAGQGLEACARAIREGRLGWNEATRAEIVRAIDDCKVMMRRLKNPEPGDPDRAAAIGVQLEKLSGRATGAMRAMAGGLDAGSRAFVAREAASIASVLSQVARAARSDSTTREPLAGIAPAMSALRGVAVLNDLPPLGDVLAAIDAAAKDASTSTGAALAESADLFESAAKALARAAREVVDTGRPEAASEEARAFAAALLASLRGATVSVESLFFDDAGPHIVKRGAAPGAALERADLVSHGEYLHAAAAELSRATTPMQRDLRLYGIAVGLAPMMSAAGSPFAAALAALALAARDAIANGSASTASEAFAGHLRAAAEALTSQNAGEAQLAERVSQAAQALGRLAGGAAAVVAERAEARAESASTPAAAAPILGGADLATSYLTLEQLIAERGMPMGKLEDLLAGVTGMPTGAPMARGPRGTRPIKPEDADVVPIESLAPQEEGIVPIESLLYRGDAALDRALQIRGELAGASIEQLTALIREVFDLVELGRGAGR